ncbi:MAG: hypothetical protein P8R54_18990 [Myxococcota bacterium]|nr:hypothetical protein [Myxococcota bacterium]
MWPLGLLGTLGAAGVVLRARKTGGVPGDIKVISRAGLSRTASLAMIEVIGSDGEPRRMLVGVGGGAPRLVADLSEKAHSSRSSAHAEQSHAELGRAEAGRYRTESAWSSADVDLVDENSTESAPAVMPTLRAPAAPAGEHPAAGEHPLVGQRLSVTTPEDPHPVPVQKLSPVHAPNASAVRVYGSQKSKASAESLNIVAQVLAERGGDKPVSEPKSDWNDPWAENFEALLARRTV